MNKIKSFSIIYLFLAMNPLIAMGSKEYLFMQMLINDCYKDTQSCNAALNKVHKYQKSAARNKRFSCQTRLLGLEANLIMRMNSNIKRKDVKSILQDIRKYC